MNEQYRIIAWDSPEKMVYNKITRANFWGRQKIIKELENQGFQVYSFPVDKKGNPKL